MSQRGRSQASQPSSRAFDLSVSVFGELTRAAELNVEASSRGVEPLTVRLTHRKPDGSQNKF